MKSKFEKILIVTVICVTVVMCSMIVVIGIVARTKAQNPEKWILKSYGNSVALFSGDKIDEIFPEVDFASLPKEDRKLLQNGIAFTTKNEALTAIEDYDG